MLPVLFRLGPFTFHTLSLFLVIAFVGTAFLFWRKTREEHYDEAQVFDGFLQSTLVGFIVGRLAFIALHLPQFGFNPLTWLDIVSRPGNTMLIGIVGAGLFLNRYAQKQKWDVFEILDFWVLALSFGLSMMWLGLFFDGTGFGYPTNLPWGVVFPSVFEKHHPTQLYLSLFFFLLFWFLAKVEYRYRTFNWYRSGKNTAQTGFLTSVFIAMSGLISVIVALLRPAELSWQGINVDLVTFVGLFGLGLVLLFVRSGRSLPFGGGRRTYLNRKP